MGAAIHPGMSYRLAIRAAALGALLTGCGGEATGLVNEPAVPLELVLGQGLTPDEFEVLPASAEPFLWHGPQGGQHLLLAVQVTNPLDERFTVGFDAELGSDCSELDCAAWQSVGRYEFP